MSDGERVEKQEPIKAEQLGEAAAETAAAMTAAAEPPTSGPEAPGPAASPHRPRKRRRRWIIAGSVVGAVIVVLVAAAFVTAHFTSRSSFCDSCHEMNAYYASWQNSAHSGAECRDCHIPSGFVPYIEKKLGSLREIYVHLSGNPKPPLAATAEIPNANCFRCHDNPPTDPSLPNVNFAHKTHAGLTCVSCHVRLVHRTVNPPVYQNPGAMASCMQCHNGTIAPSTCSTCHVPNHEARGECSTCHNQQTWTGTSFTHPFAITGGHASLDCTNCHVSKIGVENVPGSLPKADPACVSCHGDHHKGLSDCAKCHTPEGWQKTTFVHQQVGKHMPAGEKLLNCTDCHKSGFTAATCTPCHSGTPTGD